MLFYYQSFCQAISNDRMNKKEGGGSIIGSDRDLWDFVWDCRNILSDLYLFFVPQESKNQGADQGRVREKTGMETG